MAGRILTLADIHGITTADELRAWLRERRTVRLAMLRSGLADVPALDVDPDALPATARVNHGEWIADCPTVGCGSAMNLNPGLPFLCGSCLNAEIGHRWRSVSWPDAEAIEAVLLQQPLHTLRNWTPGVEVEQLSEAVEAELRGDEPQRMGALIAEGAMRRAARVIEEEVS